MTNYFSHDQNAIQDPKMMILLSECGIGAVGIYWIIVEILHQQKGGKITLEAYEKYINFYCSFENRGSDYPSKIKQTLFASGLLENDENFVWSKRVLNNKKSMKNLSSKRAEAGQKGGIFKAKNKKSLANAKQSLANQDNVLANAKQNVAKENKRKEIKRKENNNTFVLLQGQEKELEEILTTWNDVYKQELKSVRAIASNYVYWREIYEPQEIIKAIRSSPSTWLSGKPIETFFRRKNPNGENVDYISQCLNVPKETEQEGILVVRQ